MAIVEWMGSFVFGQNDSANHSSSSCSRFSFFIYILGRGLGELLDLIKANGYSSDFISKDDDMKN
jgi:hypothetical protein